MWRSLRNSSRSWRRARKERRLEYVASALIAATIVVTAFAITYPSLRYVLCGVAVVNFSVVVRLQFVRRKAALKSAKTMRAMQRELRQEPQRFIRDHEMFVSRLRTNFEGAAIRIVLPAREFTIFFEMEQSRFIGELQELFERAGWRVNNTLDRTDIIDDSAIGLRLRAFGWPRELHLVPDHVQGVQQAFMRENIDLKAQFIKTGTPEAELELVVGRKARF